MLLEACKECNQIHDQCMHIMRAHVILIVAASGSQIRHLANTFHPPAMRIGHDYTTDDSVNTSIDSQLSARCACKVRNFCKVSGSRHGGDLGFVSHRQPV